MEGGAPQVAGLVVDPVASLQAFSGGSLPWGQVLWTGLLSTDLALILEVPSLSSPDHAEPPCMQHLRPDRISCCVTPVALRSCWLLVIDGHARSGLDPADSAG